jgi:hypothetical protein
MYAHEECLYTIYLNNFTGNELENLANFLEVVWSLSIRIIFVCNSHTHQIGQISKSPNIATF